MGSPFAALDGQLDNIQTVYYWADSVPPRFQALGLPPVQYIVAYDRTAVHPAMRGGTLEELAVELQMAEEERYAPRNQFPPFLVKLREHYDVPPGRPLNAKELRRLRALRSFPVPVAVHKA